MKFPVNEMFALCQYAIASLLNNIPVDKIPVDNIPVQTPNDLPPVLLEQLKVVQSDLNNGNSTLELRHQIMEDMRPLNYCLPVVSEVNSEQYGKAPTPPVVTWISGPDEILIIPTDQYKQWTEETREYLEKVSSKKSG